MLQCEAVLLVRAITPQSDLGLGANQRDRGTQFVRGIGSELGDALHGGLNAGQHLVQRFGKALEFVAGSGCFEAAAEVGDVDRSSGTGEGVYRREGAVTQPVASKGGDEQSQRRQQ